MAGQRGRREVLGMATGASEAETFWTDVLRSLARRGLRGVKLVISDSYEGLKAAVSLVLHASWQRCRVHVMRNVLAHAGKGHRRLVSAWIGTAFAAADADAARKQWRSVADQRRPRVPKLAALMDGAAADVLAFMTFPKEHRANIHSTNPLERVNSLPPDLIRGARSSGAPMSSASSPTKRPSPDWSVPSCSNKTTTGLFSAAT